MKLNFILSDVIPTIVETKRSSDNRLRKEVVAQMLDYASNALLYLSFEEIKSILSSNYSERDLKRLLFEELGLEIDPEEFFKHVEMNLKMDKLRLVFVADIIPTKLMTLVEFLNTQIDPVEVYAVEVKQYIGGDGLKALVPRIVGESAEEQRKKIVLNKNLEELTFFEYLDESESIFYRNLLDFAKESGLIINWSSKSFSLNIEKDGNIINILRGYCNLSAFGQTLFATAGNIVNKVPNGKLIMDEYVKLEDFTSKVADG